MIDLTIDVLEVSRRFSWQCLMGQVCKMSMILKIAIRQLKCRNFEKIAFSSKKYLLVSQKKVECHQNVI